MHQLTLLRCSIFGEPCPGSPIETCCQQALALSETVSIVQARNRHCDSPFRGQRLDGCAFPGKVGRPSVGPWMKKGHQTSCLWIKRAHVGTFVSMTETPHRLPGPVRTNVSYAANYGHTPKTCPTPALLAHCSIPLHVVVTRGEMLCPKPCQSQRANGLSITRVVAQLFCTLAHRLPLCMKPLLYSSIALHCRWEQLRSHWASLVLGLHA